MDSHSKNGIIRKYSDPYGLSVWVRFLCKKKFFIILWLRICMKKPLCFTMQARTACAETFFPAADSQYNEKIRLPLPKMSPRLPHKKSYAPLLLQARMIVSRGPLRSSHSPRISSRSPRTVPDAPRRRWRRGGPSRKSAGSSGFRISDRPSWVSPPFSFILSQDAPGAPNFLRFIDTLPQFLYD